MKTVDPPDSHNLLLNLKRDWTLLLIIFIFWFVFLIREDNMYKIIINPTYPGGKMLHRPEKKFGFSERTSNESVEAIGYTASNIFEPLLIFLLQKSIYNV